MITVPMRTSTMNSLEYIALRLHNYEHGERTGVGEAPEIISDLTLG